MPAVMASAPGKIILFGEHAVVYGQPAIAVPITQVKAQVVIRAEPRFPDGQVLIHAPDINLQATLSDLPEDHPLARAIRGVLAELGVNRAPACSVRIRSTIAVAAGMGSGAAVSVALIRALSKFLGHPLSNEQVSAIAYEVEKLHHGTPSGIDNTVITYARPVYFVRGQPIQILRLPRPLHLVIADTGIASSTAAVVGDVRRRWSDEPARYEAMFDAIGAISQAARQAIEKGHPEHLGELMNENHSLLAQMGVSCPELDALAQAARRSGALGAKLSGAGRGGNMVALAAEPEAERIAQALMDNGAARVLISTVREPRSAAHTGQTG